MGGRLQALVRRGLGTASRLAFLCLPGGNCSTRLEEGAHGRARFLESLKSRQATAFAGAHDRAPGGKQVASPVGAKPVRHFSNDRAQADRLFAGVIGGWHSRIVQKAEQVVLALGLAFLPPSAVGIGGLERETAVDTALQITPVLIQGGSRQGVTTRVKGKGSQEHRLHPWREHGIASVDSKPAIPDLGGSTDLPVRSGVVLLRTLEIGHPDRRPMRPQHFVDDALSPAGAHHMEAHLGVLKHPFPLLSAVHTGAGFIAAAHPTAA
jgi:hypothetical protein